MMPVQMMLMLMMPVKMMLMLMMPVLVMSKAKKWVSGESGARWQKPGTKMEGALFAGNNNSSNIKQYKILTLPITKSPQSCHVCRLLWRLWTTHWGSDQHRFGKKRGMTSKRIRPIPFSASKFLANGRLDMDKTGYMCVFFGSPHYLMGFAIFTIIVCYLEVITNLNI